MRDDFMSLSLTDRSFVCLKKSQAKKANFGMVRAGNQKSFENVGEWERPKKTDETPRR